MCSRAVQQDSSLSARVDPEILARPERDHVKGLKKTPHPIRDSLRLSMMKDSARLILLSQTGQIDEHMIHTLEFRLQGLSRNTWRQRGILTAFNHDQVTSFLNETSAGCIECPRQNENVQRITPNAWLEDKK